ncbi:MAG: hypothetical protein H6772_02370 [Pseudomonadales bacterium]|nr:hypothetical protein [Pseudomonadales bacterium]
MTFFAESPTNATFRKKNLLGLVDQGAAEIQGLRMPSLAKIIETRIGVNVADLVKQQNDFSIIVHKLQETGLHMVTIEHRASISQQDLEEGEQLPIEELERLGVDPKLVVLYRITDPLDKPKPERMWTTDIDTFITMYEINPNGKIVIVSSLEEVATSGGGVVLDHMDTNGVSVRQIKESEFPQESIWGSVAYKDLF